MLVERFIAPWSAHGYGRRNSCDVACLSIHLASVPVPGSCAMIIEGVPLESPVLLGFITGFGGVENSFELAFAGCGVVPFSFEFYPAFADIAIVGQQALEDAFWIGWAFALGIAEACDCLGRVIVFFWCRPAVWHGMAACVRLRCVLVADEKIDHSDPETDTDKSHGYHVCFVPHHFLPCEFLSGSSSTGLTRAVQFRHGGACVR